MGDKDITFAIDHANLALLGSYSNIEGANLLTHVGTEGVAPGDHIVKLQWKVVGAESSASILVSTGFEHASMRVSEVPTIETDDGRNVAFQLLVRRFPQQSSTTTT